MKVTSVGPYVLGKTLGTGSTGKVKLAKHKDTNAEVAVKIIKRALLAEKPLLKRVVSREISIMKLLSHPQVVSLYDVYETEEKLYLIMEYVPGGELFDYLMKRKVLSEEESCKFFQQLIAGLEYCHKHFICHRDLKPENLLLDKANKLKIADFGMASIVRPVQLQETSCGSPHFAAPEVIEGGKYDGRVADVWSAGVILYALLTGCLPFHHDNVHKLLSRVKRAEFVMPSHISDPARHLIQRMLTKDQGNRISLTEIRQHAFFRKVSADPYMFVPPVIKLLPPLVFRSQLDDKSTEAFAALGFSDKDKLLDALMSESKSMERHLYTYMTTYEARVEDLRAQADALRAAAATVSVPIPMPLRRSKGVLEDIKAETRKRSESLDTGLPEARQRFMADSFRNKHNSNAVRPALPPMTEMDEIDTSGFSSHNSSRTTSPVPPGSSCHTSLPRVGSIGSHGSPVVPMAPIIPGGTAKPRRQSLLTVSLRAISPKPPLSPGSNTASSPAQSLSGLMFPSNSSGDRSPIGPHAFLHTPSSPKSPPSFGTGFVMPTRDRDMLMGGDLLGRSLPTVGTGTFLSRSGSAITPELTLTDSEPNTTTATPTGSPPTSRPPSTQSSKTNLFRPLTIPGSTVPVPPGMGRSPSPLLSPLKPPRSLITVTTSSSGSPPYASFKRAHSMPMSPSASPAPSPSNYQSSLASQSPPSDTLKSLSISGMRSTDSSPVSPPQSMTAQLPPLQLHSSPRTPLRSQHLTTRGSDSSIGARSPGSKWLGSTS